MHITMCSEVYPGQGIFVNYQTSSMKENDHPIHNKESSKLLRETTSEEGLKARAEEGLKARAEG